MNTHPRRGATVDRCAGIVPLLVASMSSIALAGDGTCPADIGVLHRQGDAAPGTPDAFQTFDRPNVSAAGDVCFAADTDGPTAADDVVYLNDILIAREGDPAPGVPGATLGPFEFFETSRQVNAAGEVVYITTLANAPDGDRAVYRNASLVVREGHALAGAPDRLLTDFGFAGITDDGTVGFLGDLDGSTASDSVIVLGDAILYRETGFVPDMNGAQWDGNFDELQWNGRGDLIFEGNTSLASDEDVVVFRRMHDGAGNVVESVVAQEGQVIATADGPDALAMVQQTALAENGDWALRGNLAMAAADRDAIVLAERGVVAQEGDLVPELPGTEVGNFTAVDVNAAGDVVYLADLNGLTPPDVDEGIFVNGCLIVTDGTPAPGLPEGTRLTDIGFEDVFVNDDGVIVFAAAYGGAVSGDGLFVVTLARSCRGDIDGDGVVGFGDLTAMYGVWGPCDGCEADMDGSGTVDFEDLLELLTLWGSC